MNEGLLGTEDDMLLQEGGDDGYIISRNQKYAIMRYKGFLIYVMD